MLSRNTLRNMERFKNFALWLVLALFVVSLLLNVRYYTVRMTEPYRDTTRTTFVDTILYYKPVPKDSVVIRYVTQRLPVVDDKEDNFQNKGNNVAENIPDSADVVIPITQTIYEDSTYTAYVSGYNANLDSLILRMPREVITVKEYRKPKRWSVGVQVGYGMTLKGTPQFAPYVGIGVSYNLFSF